MITRYGVGGLNSHGEIGDGTNKDKEAPIKILDNVVSIKSGETSFALTNKGELLGWGKNSNGELGDGTMNERVTPFLILNNVKSFSGYAEKNDGTIWAWGEYYSGKDFTNNLNPVVVKFDKNYIPKNTKRILRH